LEIRIEKNWQAAGVLIVLVGQLIGAAWWGTQVWLELRDSRIAQQNQVQVITTSVNKLSSGLEDLAHSLADHEKRITVNDVRIRNLERE